MIPIYPDPGWDHTCNPALRPEGDDVTFVGIRTHTPPKFPVSIRDTKTLIIIEAKAPESGFEPILVRGSWYWLRTWYSCTEPSARYVDPDHEPDTNNRLPDIGKWGCDDTHYGEQYVIRLTDGRYIYVAVWVPHSADKAMNHASAIELLLHSYPETAMAEIEQVIYA